MGTTVQPSATLEDRCITQFDSLSAVNPVWTIKKGASPQTIKARTLACLKPRSGQLRLDATKQLDHFNFTYALNTFKDTKKREQAAVAVRRRPHDRRPQKLSRLAHRKAPAYRSDQLQPTSFALVFRSRLTNQPPVSMLQASADLMLKNFFQTETFGLSFDLM
jgi:hypothetical protein